jgi:hypothetical protein
MLRLLTLLLLLLVARQKKGKEAKERLFQCIVLLSVPQEEEKRTNEQIQERQAILNATLVLCVHIVLFFFSSLRCCSIDDLMLHIEKMRYHQQRPLYE